tara:strand:- start:203 stop:907 length:705 start_codon:yes stop_codon:yes gene_type:complete
MIICLICARKGSKRLPRKNLLKIKNKSLLAHSIIHAKSIQEINDVVVSTDCKEIAEEGKMYGAKVPFLRPRSLAKDDTPEWEVWQHALKHYNNKNIFPTTIIILPTTAPLRKKDNIKSALEIYNSSYCDGVISVTESNRNPTFNMVKENSLGFAELAIKPEKKIFRAQDAKPFFDVTTVCYVMRPSFILSSNSIFDGNIKLNHIPKENSVDIDTELDLKWANFLIDEVDTNVTS